MQCAKFQIDYCLKNFSRFLDTQSSKQNSSEVTRFTLVTELDPAPEQLSPAPE